MTDLLSLDNIHLYLIRDQHAVTGALGLPSSNRPAGKAVVHISAVEKAGYLDSRIYGPYGRDVGGDVRLSNGSRQTGILLRSHEQNPCGGVCLPMREFNFEPIEVDSAAPGGACTLRSFDEIGAFILISVDVTRRLSPHWNAVRRDLVQVRFGARRAEVHQAMRDALAAEGWLADEA